MLFTSHIATGLEEGKRLGQVPEHVGVAAATQVQAVQLEGGQHEPKHNLILPHLFFYHMKSSMFGIRIRWPSGSESAFIKRIRAF